METKLVEEASQIDTVLDEKVREQMKNSIEKKKLNLKELFNTTTYTELYNSGRRKLTQEALMGALMIYVYRALPRFSQPFQILILLVDIDEQLMKWRYAHSTMVQRMIGSNIGTGNSSGYSYLRATISDHYKVFNDLNNLATYLIPDRLVPVLPKHIEDAISVPVYL